MGRRRRKRKRRIGKYSKQEKRRDKPQWK